MLNVPSNLYLSWPIIHMGHPPGAWGGELTLFQQLSYHVYQYKQKMRKCCVCGREKRYVLIKLQKIDDMMEYSIGYDIFVYTIILIRNQDGGFNYLLKAYVKVHTFVRENWYIGSGLTLVLPKLLHSHSW